MPYTKVSHSVDYTFRGLSSKPCPLAGFTFSNAFPVLLMETAGNSFVWNMKKTLSLEGISSPGDPTSDAHLLSVIWS